MYIVAFILVLVLVVCYLHSKGSIKFVKTKSARVAPSPPALLSPKESRPSAPHESPPPLQATPPSPIPPQPAHTAQAAKAQGEKHKEPSQGGKSCDKKRKGIPSQGDKRLRYKIQATQGKRSKGKRQRTKECKARGAGERDKGQRGARQRRQAQQPCPSSVRATPQPADRYPSSL